MRAQHSQIDILVLYLNPEAFIPRTSEPSTACYLLKKEVRPFFLGDNSIMQSFPSVSSLSDHSIGGPECYFNLAIIAFGAFGFIVPKYCYRLGEMDKRRLDSLI